METVIAVKLCDYGVSVLYHSVKSVHVLKNFHVHKKHMQTAIGKIPCYWWGSNTTLSFEVELSNYWITESIL